MTNSMCWARFARASLGTYALAAWSWRFRHRKLPWDELLGASGRLILRHDGLSCGSLIMDDTDNKRSKAAKTLAHRYQLRDKDSGGYVWGHSLGCLVLGTPPSTLPVGFAFSQPAPELSAWYKQDKILKKHGVPTKQRRSKPPAHPHSPTQQDLALRLLHQCQAHPPALTVSCLTADALYGTAPFVDTASALCGGVQVISPRRSTQNVRVHTRAHPVADSFAAPPGTPQAIRIRGGARVVALVSSARWYVCSHKTKRFVVAIQYDGEEPSRYLLASALTWRTLAIGQGQTLRWPVEVFIQDWQSYAGWSQLTKQPGEEGARRSVPLRLLVDHRLFFHPDHHAQLKNNLPAYTVGSLRAHVQVESLVGVMEHVLSSADPQSPLQRFTHTVHEVLAFG